MKIAFWFDNIPYRSFSRIVKRPSKPGKTTQLYVKCILKQLRSYNRFRKRLSPLTSWAPRLLRTRDTNMKRVTQSERDSLQWRNFSSRGVGQTFANFRQICFDFAYFFNKHAQARK